MRLGKEPAHLVPSRTKRPPVVDNKIIAKMLRLIEKEMRKHSPPIITLQAQTRRDPFRTLIATKLSLRTKDATTAAASERLFAVADTPEKMSKLSVAKLEKLIYPVSFFRNKARTIKKVCKILLDEYDGIVPDEIDELVKLPGVGRKTANLVLIEGYQKLAMCVDTHVHRISNIWGYVKTPDPDKTETALREKLPKKHWIKYNELLVGWGQQICAPVSPKCSECPAFAHCPRIGVKRSR